MGDNWLSSLLQRPRGHQLRKAGLCGDRSTVGERASHLTSHTSFFRNVLHSKDFNSSVTKGQEAQCTTEIRCTWSCVSLTSSTNVSFYPVDTFNLDSSMTTHSSVFPSLPISFILNKFRWNKFTWHKSNHLKVNNFVAFGTFTTSCNHLYLVPTCFHHPKRKFCTH